MTRKILDILDECIESLNAGIPADECLAKYPRESRALRQILVGAVELKSLDVDEIPAASMLDSQQQVLAQARIMKAKAAHLQSISRSWWKRPIFNVLEFFQARSPIAAKALLSLSIAGVLIICFGGLWFTSAKALPGEPFFPVKLAVEDLRVSFVHNPDAKHSYEDTYSLQRIQEVKSLIGMERIQAVSFKGSVQSIGEQFWNISGIQVMINSDTDIEGGEDGFTNLETGAAVQVDGITSPQGWVVASKIHIREYQFFGTVEKINPGYWIVSGTKLIVQNSTMVEPGLATGDNVVAFVHVEDSGLYILKISHHTNPEITATEDLPTLPFITPSALDNHTGDEFQIQDTYENLETLGVSEENGSSTIEPQETETSGGEIDHPDSEETPEPWEEHTDPNEP